MRGGWEGPARLKREGPNPPAQISLERIQPRFPEQPVAFEPVPGFPHRAGSEHAIDHTALFLALDEPGVLEHVQVLHESRQRHVERPCKLGHRAPAANERRQYAPARRVGQGREHRVEARRSIVNHKV